MKTGLNLPNLQRAFIPLLGAFVGSVCAGWLYQERGAEVTVPKERTSAPAPLVPIDDSFALRAVADPKEVEAVFAQNGDSTIQSSGGEERRIRRLDPSNVRPAPDPDSAEFLEWSYSNRRVGVLDLGDPDASP